MGGGDFQPLRSYPQFDRKPRGPEIRHIYNDRLSQFTDTGEYRDVNLQSMLYHGKVDSAEYLSVEVYSAPDLARPLFKHAVKSKFRETSNGEQFGPSWSTHWFKITIKSLPESWSDKERVQLEFDLPEGLVYSADGLPLQGLTGGQGGDRRVDFILDSNVRKATNSIFYIETSMNGMFGVGGEGSIQPPDPNRYFRLQYALVCPDMDAWRLLWDFTIIRDISRQLPQSRSESHEALRTANQIMNTFQRADRASIAKCRDLASAILGKQRDSTKVYSNNLSAPVLAVGHCHIDTAWLWPFAETKRKIARSWSTQCDLMERYPEHTFTCSQAQQFQWLEEDYPLLFERVKKMIIDKHSFEPIGGTWVEMDTNMPSGESLVRQFLFGQRYFQKHFGKRCKVFWLPDTFGYSSQLPQLARSASMTSFFTQKLSWNNIDSFPHTTFNWQALDGSQVLAHMAPDETYTAQADLSDVLRSESQHKNLSDDPNSLLVFGNGDGGGGPLAAMLEKLRRCRGASDTKASSIPRVKLGTVTDFYAKLATDSDYGRNLRNWSGELYFEFHRGTFTSQALTKYYNRASEKKLHEIEYFASLASLTSSKYKYPRNELGKLWEDVLLCQFHDVLPGSCIEMVYEDEHKIHKDVLNRGGALLEQALAALEIAKELPVESSHLIAINSLSWDRQEILEHNGELCVVASEGISPVSIMKSKGDAKIVEHGNGLYTLSNKNLIVKIDDGNIISFYDRVEDRELIPAGERANQFQIYDDQPLSWQAWDVELFHLDKSPSTLTNAKTSIISTNNKRVSILVEHKISGKSWIKSVISLDSSDSEVNSTCKQLNINCTAEWHENKRFLKVAFPTTLHASQANYETQFGVIQRPTHFNTTWDEAKFEVCCHKFADLSEFNYGLSILNDCKYGFATHGNVMRLSLLRSPKAPDAHADMGRHVFKYAMVAHASSFEQSGIVRRGYEFNYPLRLSRRPMESVSLDHFGIEGDQNVVLDTIKLAEDSESVVLRYFESLGGRGRAKLTVPKAFQTRIESVWKTNILEDLLEELEFKSDATVEIQLRPFEVQTCLFKITL